MSSSKKKRHYRQEKEELEAEERGIALGLVGTEPTEVKVDPVEDTTQVEDLTDEEVELGEQVVQELEVEDGEEEVQVEEETVSEEDKEASLLETVIDFFKDKLGKKKVAYNGISPFVVLKDTRGDYRYLAVVSNNYKDRDGDIITDAAHKEFMSYLDEHPSEAPELWIWHTPGTAHKSRADFWAYENGFVIYSGALTKEEATRATKASERRDIGMSHGLNIYPADIVLERDPQRKLITKYRTFEISYLPLERAANPWTAWSVISKEVEQMDEAKKKFLEDTLGADMAASLIEDTEKAKGVLDALKVESKETKDETQSQPAETPAIEEVVKAVAEQFGMKQLSEVIADLKKSVDELKADSTKKQEILDKLNKSDDQKIAEQIQVAPAHIYSWLEKAQSQSEETVLDPEKPEDKELEESVPKPSWFNEVYG